MAFVPQDMMIGIQCRLGVKDLLRFKCVSKSWCSLINDPYFIKLHLSHTSHSSDLEVYDRFFNPPRMQEIKYPYDGQLVGSCNGLLALCKGYRPNRWHSNEDIPPHEIWLCNPSTRESRMLPSLEIKVSHFATLIIVQYGFGYDPISEDYKLIRLMWESFSYVNVNVYSLRTNSWRRIEDFPSDRQLPVTNGVLANNALHWVAYKKSKDDPAVVAFDLVDEEFRVIELSDCLDKVVGCVALYVKAIKGCLCLIAQHSDFLPVSDRKWGDNVVDIWMMKQQSWTKLISVTNSEFSDLRYNRVVGNIVRLGDLLCLNVVESLVPVTRMQ